ncbi:MAG: diguanylate cyclase [Acidobacteriia bacterium]|nr:diguanylate cyclase [Terriglobia bacterium]
MTNKQGIYRRYETVFVFAYAIAIALILIMAHFPGSRVLNIAGFYKWGIVAVIYNIIFYFLIPSRFTGRNKTLLGTLFAVFFINVALWYSGFDQSPFFFLYYLAIVTSVLYLGPRETIMFSALIAACYLFMAKYADHSLFSLTTGGFVQLVNMAGLVLMASFGSVLAQLIKERGRLARSKAEKFSALNTLTQKLTSTLEDGKILEHVVDSICQLLNVPMCFLWTVGEASNDLTARAIRTPAPLPEEACRLRVGEGLVGWVAARREMVVLEDVMEDSRIQFRDIARQQGIVSYMAFPLLFGERLLGVLEIATMHPRRFTGDEISLCRSFAAQSAIALNNSRLFAQENERVRRLAGLKKYRDAIQMAEEESAVTKALTHVLDREFDLSQILVMKKTSAGRQLELRNLRTPTPPDFTFSVLGEPDGCRALRSSRRLLVNDMSQDNPCPHNCHNELTGSYLCLPLIIGGVVTGVVHLNSRKEHYWTLDQITFAETFVDQTAPILSSLNSLRQAEQRAIIDSLTSLYNRRFLFEFMQQQIVQSRRYHNPLSILMLDLDHFKRVNDTYGHESGDIVLKLFALRLKESLRISDIAARYGGEEFVAVLPNTSLKGAMELAEKIRVVTTDVNLAQFLPDLPSISVSIGVACFPNHGRTIEQLQRAADAALYQAKQAGRNRVVSADFHLSKTPIESHVCQPV